MIAMRGSKTPLPKVAFFLFFFFLVKFNLPGFKQNITSVAV